MSILSAKNLTVGYRKGSDVSPVISGMSLELNEGRLVALIGANGAGKSTLLRTIVGSQPALEGFVTVAGKSIDEISRKELSLLLAIVNTERTHTGGLTVRELVALGRQPYTGFLGILGRNDKEIVETAMKDAGIFHKAECFTAELSDGERQKAMIAKALAQQTPIIVLDEPTAFLDVASRMETMMLLHRLAHEQNKAILLSSHDLSQSIMLADEMWVVAHDKSVLSGNTEDLVMSGAMQKVFSSSLVDFDLLQGDYCIEIEPARYVNLTCNDAVLVKWITNALKRNGFGVNNDTPQPITITAISPTNIEITVQEKQITVTSIKELIETIK